jgi:hypothetical protein
MDKIEWTIYILTTIVLCSIVVSVACFSLNRLKRYFQRRRPQAQPVRHRPRVVQPELPGGFEVDGSKGQIKEIIGRGSYGVVHKAAIENVK